METIRIYLYFTVLRPEITLKKEMIKSLDSLQILSYVWPDAGFFFSLLKIFSCYFRFQLRSDIFNHHANFLEWWM